MQLEAKIIISIVALGLAVWLMRTDSRSNHAGPHWLWRGGKGDLFRTVVYRDDGSFRRFSKLGILAFWAGVIGLLWLFPTKGG